MSDQIITLIKGDGIGPEIASAVQEIFSAASVPISWEVAEAGLYCIERYGNGLPQETLDSIARNKIALKSPTTTPIGGGHKSINVTIRKSLDLFANVRPSKSLPGIKTRFDNVDLIIVRENIEDTYGGIEYQQTPEVAQALRLITRSGSRNVSRYAFEMAQVENRKRVTCVHKANIHKITDGLFLHSFQEVAETYPKVKSNDILIDNLCMQLVTHPEQFDVLVLPNLFGDIASDLCAGLVGGLGVAPGGNIGRDAAVFEAVHGSAPDIAGKGLANPTALLLSSVQMLRYLGLHEYADRIEQALRLTLVSGIKTRDLGGNATTREFTHAIISELGTISVPKVDSTLKSQVHHSRIIINQEPLTVSKDGWKLVGVDVFIEAGSFPQLPSFLGKFTLSMISNRGTKIYPGKMPDILLIDCFRTRWLANQDVTNGDLLEFLGLFPAAYPWMHIEKLHNQGDTPMFSKAQGE